MAGYFKEVYLLDNIRNIWLFKSNPKVGSSHTTTPLPHPHQKKQKKKKRQEERKQSTSTPKRIRSFAFKFSNNSRGHPERPIWSCDLPLFWRKGNDKVSKGSWLK